MTAPRTVDGAVLFPTPTPTAQRDGADGGDGDTTATLLVHAAGPRLPLLDWVEPAALTGGQDEAEQLAACRAPGTGVPIVIEHSRGTFRRPGLRGHRLVQRGDAVRTGHDWSTSFTTDAVELDAGVLVVRSHDESAQLGLVTEIESLPGGALRMRHTLTNTASTPYLLEGLEVCLPLPDSARELLDFTGRHERERVPQRHDVADGAWVRENRRGRTGLESATLVVAGERGFGFATGRVVGVHVAHSGNSVVYVERDQAGAGSVAAGELLMPGEITLGENDSYRTPWVFVATGTGLDSLAASLHTWQRSLAAHPVAQPVLLNVWEAVYFDHDLPRLTKLADLAAQVGVERFVLDDGWFTGRRLDDAGLGDWAVDADVWPEGLHPLVDHVHALGMQFGLWFEPEMVNPDSALYREHPDWILSAGGRVPALSRNQLVLDLTIPEVWSHLLAGMDAVLGEYEIDYVKWDHNRDLVDAGSGPAGVPAGHRQTEAYYALLDELRRRHPGVEWESCAAGGGRIDLGVLERVQRVWTSDMTDSMSRQQIQRWSVQLVAPEYLGAHVSAPVSHQTGRSLSLDFRAATSVFGAFGIEWDLTEAGSEELDSLARWVQLFKRHRPLLHSGRTVRIESGDPSVWLHGVVAQDRRSALIAHVQLDEAQSNRGVVVRVPGLDPDLHFRAAWEGPIDLRWVSQCPPLDPAGPTRGVPVSGAALGAHGFAVPRRRPETISLVHLEALP